MQEQLIKSTLNNILSELNRLQLLLNKEKELLAASDFENITEIAEQKKQIITSIEIDNSRFKEMLKSIDSGDSEKSIHDIITENIPDSANLWTEIEILLKTCKNKNSVNGIILSNNRRQVQQSISILQGQSNETLTYGETGESIAIRSTFKSPISA